MNFLYWTTDYNILKIQFKQSNQKIIQTKVSLHDDNSRLVVKIHRYYSTSENKKWKKKKKTIKVLSAQDKRKSFVLDCAIESQFFGATSIAPYS